MGVYRLYHGKDLLHIGMAAGAATLRSELARHARGDYGPGTQRADRVDWEVVPDDLYAYEAFVALYNEAIYAGCERAGEDWAPSTSRCHGGDTGVSYGCGSMDIHHGDRSGDGKHRLEAGAPEELVLSPD